MKRIYVDDTWLRKPEDVSQFEARLLARDREGLVPGATVVIEGDGMDDRMATSVEFLDDHIGVFSFVPIAGANAAEASSNRRRRTWSNSSSLRSSSPPVSTPSSSWPNPPERTSGCTRTTTTFTACRPAPTSF